MSGPHGLAAVPFGDTLFVIAGCTARGVVVPHKNRAVPAAGMVFRGR
jgi:hypothetical protein